MSYLGDGRWSILAVTHLGDNCLFMLQNAAFTYNDYVDFLTTYLSLVHVITPDDLVGTLHSHQPPSSPSAPLLRRWTKGDPELSSSIYTTVVGAFTNRFLFLSPLVSGPSAGATEMGEAEMGSEVASVDDPTARRLLASAISFCRRSLLEVISASVKHGKGLVHKESRKRTSAEK